MYDEKDHSQKRKNKDGKYNVEQLWGRCQENHNTPKDVMVAVL